MSRSGALVLLLVLAVGCDDDKPKAAPTASATPNASAVSSAAATPPEKQLPWYAGAWSGTYDAQHFLIEMDKKQGAVRAWSEDDGGRGTGEGSVSLTVTEAGAISGEAKGPLGEHVLSGQVDEDTLRVKLMPKAPGADAFTGFFLVKKQGEGLEGRLQASSGDSLTVRDAPVKLQKGGSASPAPAPAAPPAAASAPSAAPAAPSP